jgi:hypothetical protein
VETNQDHHLIDRHHDPAGELWIIEQLSFDIKNAVQTSIPTLPPVVATGYPVPNVPTSTVAGDRSSSAPVSTSTITENQSGSTLVPTIDSSLASFLPRPDMTPGEADPRVT